MDGFIFKLYEYYAFLAFIEWNVNVSAAYPAIELSITYINRSNKGLLSPRTFTHSELLHKTTYFVLNFKSNLGTYGHDLLAYERDARGANCAHEPGFSVVMDLAGKSVPFLC